VTEHGPLSAGLARHEWVIGGSEFTPAATVQALRWFGKRSEHVYNANNPTRMSRRPNSVIDR